MHGAALGAVGAARAGHRDVRVDDGHGLLDAGFLPGVQRAEILHIAGVVQQLGHIAHAGEHDLHVGLAGRETDGPGRHRGFRRVGFEHFLHRPGHFGQRAALDRLHDDDRLAVLFGYLIAFAGLHALAVPVQIIDLELYKLHFRVLGQDAVQQVRMVVEGKADVPDHTLFLLLLQPGKAVQLFVDLVVLGAHVVQQVVVKIPRAGLFQLGVEDLVPILQRMDEARMQFVRQGEAVPRMAAGQRLLDGVLALERTIHPGRVKVGEPPFEEDVHHLPGLPDVDAARIVGVRQRQPHQAEPQFFGIVENIHRSQPPFSAQCALLSVLYNLKYT